MRSCRIAPRIADKRGPPLACAHNGPPSDATPQRCSSQWDNQRHDQQVNGNCNLNSSPLDAFVPSDGRGSGGLGGRPSPLVARHPDRVQSSKHRYSTASPDGQGTSRRRAAVQERARNRVGSAVASRPAIVVSAGTRWLYSVVRPSGPSTISVAPASYGPSTTAGFLSCIAIGQ